MDLDKLRTLQEKLKAGEPIEFEQAKVILEEAKTEVECHVCKGYLDATQRLLKKEDKETASKLLGEYLNVAKDYEEIYQLKKKAEAQKKKTDAKPDRPISTLEKLMFAKIDEKDFIFEPRLEKLVVKILDTPFNAFNLVTNEIFNAFEGKKK